MEEAVAAHLCPAATVNWRVRNRGSFSSKPCHATANFTGRAFSAVGQAASALHVIVILQVHQAKLVKSLDEGRLDPEVFKHLVHAMDLALRATNLWLTLTELKDSEKTALLDASVNPSGLFKRWWRHSRSALLKHKNNLRPLATPAKAC